MACDELVGSAISHVMMSQMIAPNSPPKMTYMSTIFGSISLSLMVLATPVPKTKAATKLKNAAQNTACTGDKTRVVTTVATEFAASWKPLKISNISASPIRKNRSEEHTSEL